MATAVIATNGSNFHVASFKNKIRNRYTITMSSSYTTGGEAVTAASLGMTTINSMILGPAGGYTFKWDSTNGKIMAYSTAATEVTATTNLSAITDIIAEVWGD